MDSTVAGALIAVGGVFAGLAWSAAQHMLMRRQRIEETLRTERQARYAEFIGLADELLIEIERCWSALSPAIHSLSITDELLSDPGSTSAPESVRMQWQSERESTVRELEQGLVGCDRETWRSGADAVRASRIVLELVGSRGAGQQALKINEDLYELIGALSSADDVVRAGSIIGSIRGARQLFLDHAKRDVQLTQGRRGSSA